MTKVYELFYMQDCCGQASQVTFGYVRTLEEALRAVDEDGRLSIEETTLSADEMWQI